MAGEPVVERLLLSADGRAVRVFAASCAERLSPVFGALRNQPERADDVSLIVQTLGDLWDPSVPAAGLASKLEMLSALQELQPSELGLRLVADIYAFYAALVTMHAVEAAIGDDNQAALECSHVCLTPMGQLDANVSGGTFYDEETNRQQLVLEMVTTGTYVGHLRAEDQLIARKRISAILARVA